MRSSLATFSTHYTFEINKNYQNDILVRNLSVGILYFSLSSYSLFLQSGASSLAKHGGAYFSAVCRSIQDPITALGPYENQEP